MEHILGLQGSSRRGRTRAEEHRLKDIDQQGALPVDYELQIALAVEDEPNSEGHSRTT